MSSYQTRHLNTASYRRNRFRATRPLLSIDALSCRINRLLGRFCSRVEGYRQRRGLLHVANAR